MTGQFKEGYQFIMGNTNEQAGQPIFRQTFYSMVGD